MTMIIGGVDGTGPSEDDEYKVEFQSSHVSTLTKRHPEFLATKYLRGPAALGSETQGLANNIAIWAEQQMDVMKLRRKENPNVDLPDPHIYLTGYSRGGASVINACLQLQGKGIPVHCLMLFDAVDRSTISDVDIIPGNVKFAFHARRHPSAGSREMFGNCGTRAAPGVKYVENFFYCTHGGVGGTPWDKDKSDGRIHEMTDGQKAGMLSVGAAGGPLAFKAANDFIHVNDPTNVTLEQDKAGSKLSMDWMLSRMATVRHSNLLTG